MLVTDDRESTHILWEVEEARICYEVAQRDELVLRKARGAGDGATLEFDGDAQLTIGSKVQVERAAPRRWRWMSR